MLLLLFHNLGWSETTWEEENPQKPIFATFSSKSEPAELLFPENGEGHTNNPLQETSNLEKHGKKPHLEVWDGIPKPIFGFGGGSVKTWEFRLGNSNLESKKDFVGFKELKSLL